MSTAEYAFLSFSTLFLILDPFAVIPSYLVMTQGDSLARKERTARLACLVAAVILLIFSLVGEAVFRLMGISMPAFQVAGSIVLLMVALDMLRAQKSSVKETEEETQAGIEKDETAITPLAVPMLAGPGALSTALLLQSQAENWVHRTVFHITIFVVCLCSYVILRIASHGAKWIGPITMKVITRIMGLLLAAMSVQFLVNGLDALHIIQLPD